MDSLEIEIQDIDEENDSMLLDMIGVDTAIANAFRRILLAEVPVMAIEDCCVLQNNSVLQDEVLCHRLGLLPIKCDPRIFDWIDEENSRYDRGQDPSNTLIFKLHVECRANPKAKAKDPPHRKCINAIVTSKDIEWVPQPGQMELLQQHNPPPIQMVFDDIIIAKLRPGQSIEISMRAIKGVGRDHAKFSPVGTASYRLLPHIEMEWNEDIENGLREPDPQQLEYLKALCPRNVFDVEGDRIVANRPRDCSLCRACIMDDGVNEAFGKSMVDRSDSEKRQYLQFIKLRKRRNHFIFSIENIGQYPAVTDLLMEAIKVLKAKCQTLIEGVDAMKAREDEKVEMDDVDSDSDDNMQDVD